MIENVLRARQLVQQWGYETHLNHHYGSFRATWFGGRPQFIARFLNGEVEVDNFTSEIVYGPVKSMGSCTGRGLARCWEKSLEESVEDR